MLVRKCFVALILLLWKISSGKILCNQNACPYSKRGDGNCDQDCMTTYCGYDSAFSDENSAKKDSDCFWDCISVDGCDPAKLGDGICDEVCDTKNCGHDRGDCGDCASSCFLSLQVENGESKDCDPDCNVPSCYYGLGNCQECSIGCTAEMMGDGVCDIECQTLECNFDLGDCYNAICGPGCFLWMIGNSICDEACHVEDCDYDKYDCDCSPGCFQHMLGDGNCDEACDNWDCALDDHDCGACADGCYPEMLGDTKCDSECNNENCYYDYQDCQCAEGCTYLDYGNCKPECMVASCNYDKVHQFRDLWCQNTSLAIFSSYQQNIRKNYTYVTYLEDCYTASDYSCTLEKAFDLENCYEECNIIECNYANGNCNKGNNDMEHNGCARTYGSGADKCISCFSLWSGYALSKGKCFYYTDFFSQCPYLFPDGSLVLWDYSDVSSISNPYLYFLTSVQDGTSYVGDGTFNSPFKSFVSTMKLLSYRYSTIYILDDGNHSLSTGGYSYSNFYCQNSLYNFYPKHLKIDSWTGKRVYLTDLIDLNSMYYWSNYMNNMTYEISNVIFDASFTSDDCSGIYCDYCPFILYEEGIGSLNDRGEVVTDFLPENLCEFPWQSVFFLDIASSNAFFTNVSFINFRVGVTGIINYYENSNITLTNVTFDNIILWDIEFSAAIVGGCDSFEGCTEAKYVLPCGTLSYDGGVVSRINNGYELLDPKDFRGFLYIATGVSASFSNVEFKNNIVHRKEFNLDIESELSTASLINANLSKSLEIDSCTFHYNYCELGLINVKFNLSSNSTEIDEDLVVKNSKVAYLSIKNSHFESNYGKNYGILKAEFSGQSQSVLIDNSTFVLNGIEKGPLIDIQAGYIDEEHLIDTYFNYTIPSSGAVVQVEHLAKWLNVTSVQFSENYSGKSGIMDIRRMGNVMFSNVSMWLNGGDADINSIILNFYISDPDLYLKLKVKNPASLDCDSLVSISDSINFTMLAGNVTSNYCQSSAPSIVVSNTTNPLIKSSHFISNSGKSSNGICLYFASLSSVLISNSEFIDNKNNLQSNPGAIYIESTVYQLSLIDCNFDGNSADLGGALYFAGQILSVESTHFSSNISPFLSGGAIYYSLEVYKSGSQVFSISNSQFKKNIGSTAGAIYIQWKPSFQKELSFYVHDSEFSSNQAAYGSAIYIESTVALSSDSLIKNCIFQENKAESSGIVSVFYAYGILQLEECDFIGNSGSISAALEISIGENSANSQSKVILLSCRFSLNVGNSIVLMQDSSTYSTLETFNCKFISNTGAAFSLDYDFLSDVGSAIENNYFNSSGAALELRNSAKVQSSNLFIYNCSTLKNGGVASMSSESQFVCTSCSFIKNSAGLLGGAIYAASNSYFVITNSIFKENSCLGQGSVLYVVSALLNPSVVERSRIEENFSGGEGTIYVLSAEIMIKSTTILNNTSSGNDAGLYLTNSAATIIKTTFSHQVGSQGCFIYANTASQAIIQDSFILSGKSDNSGTAISILGSTVNISNTVFMNLSSSDGAVISLDSGSFLMIENSSISDCSCLIINANSCKIYIENTTFQDYTKSAISGIEMKILQISDSRFSNGFGSIGGAIYCSNCKETAIVSSIFANNTSSEGGALYFVTDADDPSDYQCFISSSTFTNNSASTGGAIWANNINLEIYKSTFIENSAISLEPSDTEQGITDGTGGAVNFNCKNFGSCIFNITLSFFYWNNATFNGGAVNWNNAKQIFNSNEFANNSAEYGDDMSSFPVAMVYVNSTNENHSRKATSDLVLTNIASGQENNPQIAFALVDHLNQVIKTDNISQAQLHVVSPSSALISGLTVANAVNGIFNFTDYTITSEPGSSSQIRVYTSAIIEQNSSTEFSPSFYIDVKFRLCQLGEATVNGTCYICEEPYYSLNPNNTACLACPSSAICYGNYTMVPKKGYWRSNMMTDKFWKCPYQDACLGSQNEKNLSLTGECKKGYKGNMCQSCQDNYSRLYKNRCIKCPGIVSNVFRLLGFVAFIIVVSTIMVKTARNSVYRPTAFTSVYLKIFWNFLQIMVIITTFDLNWPNDIIELFHVHDILDFTGQLLYSLDCFLQLSVSQDSVYYKQIIIASGFPFLLEIFCFLGLLLFKFRKRRFQYIMDDFISTSVVLLFLIHPSLMHEMFNIFSCKEINSGELWLNAELDIRCWTSEHSFYAFLIAMPTIVIWGVAIPAMCLSNLVKNRARLEEVWIKLRYGFLFNGYSSNHYYWEFALLYSKITLITFSIFLSNVSITVQAIAVAILLFAYFCAQHRNRPFIFQVFNRMELISKSVSLLTVISGLFFLTKSLNYTGTFFLTVFTMLSNVLFILWCIFKASSVLFKTLKILILYFKRGSAEIGIDQNYESNATACKLETSQIQSQSYNLVPNQTFIGTIQDNLYKSSNEIFSQEDSCSEKNPLPLELDSIFSEERKT